LNIFEKIAPKLDEGLSMLKVGIIKYPSHKINNIIRYMFSVEASNKTLISSNLQLGACKYPELTKLSEIVMGCSKKGNRLNYIQEWRIKSISVK